MRFLNVTNITKWTIKAPFSNLCSILYSVYWPAVCIVKFDHLFVTRVRYSVFVEIQQKKNQNNVYNLLKINNVIVFENEAIDTVIVNFEHISYIIQLFLLLTFNKQTSAE